MNKIISFFRRIVTIIILSGLMIFIVEILLSVITTFQVNTKLGFRYATPCLPDGEPFLITRVIPGKAMALAGLKRHDEVQMDDTGDLYRLLINNQGGVAVFSVIRDGKPVIIQVKVPAMSLPLKQVSFLF